MQNPGIHPLSHYLLLDVTPQEQTTAAGIVLPTAVQGASTRMEGTIAACGPRVSIDELTSGTRVCVSRYSSGEIMRAGRIYKLALETDVIAVLDSVSASMPEPRISPLPTL
jgi:co-chaperonin GroES (HSP10)